MKLKVEDAMLQKLVIELPSPPSVILESNEDDDEANVNVNVNDVVTPSATTTMMSRQFHTAVYSDHQDVGEAGEHIDEPLEIFVNSLHLQQQQKQQQQHEQQQHEQHDHQNHPRREPSSESSQSHLQPQPQSQSQTQTQDVSSSSSLLSFSPLLIGIPLPFQILQQLDDAHGRNASRNTNTNSTGTAKGTSKSKSSNSNGHDHDHAHVHHHSFFNDDILPQIHPSLVQSSLKVCAIFRNIRVQQSGKKNDNCNGDCDGSHDGSHGSHHDLTTNVIDLMVLTTRSHSHSHSHSHSRTCNNNNNNDDDDVIITAESESELTNMMIQEINGEPFACVPTCAIQVITISQVHFVMTSSSTSTSASETPTTGINTRTSTTSNNNTKQMEIPLCPVCRYRIEPQRFGLPPPKQSQRCSQTHENGKSTSASGNTSARNNSNNSNNNSNCCENWQFLAPWSAPTYCEACQLLQIRLELSMIGASQQQQQQQQPPFSFIASSAPSASSSAAISASTTSASMSTSTSTSASASASASTYNHNYDTCCTPIPSNNNNRDHEMKMNEIDHDRNHDSNYNHDNQRRRHQQQQHNIKDRLKCYQCGMEETLWVCLSCGIVGCGRYSGGHAEQHYNETGHAFSLELATQKIWDYETGSFVHRDDLITCPFIQRMLGAANANVNVNVNVNMNAGVNVNMNLNLHANVNVNVNTSTTSVMNGNTFRATTEYPNYNGAAIGSCCSSDISCGGYLGDTTNNIYCGGGTLYGGRGLEFGPSAKKAIMVGEEYEALLQSALEDQAQHFEMEIAHLKADLAADAIHNNNISPLESMEIERLERETARVRKDIDTLGRDLIEQQAQEAGHRAKANALLREQNVTEELLKKIRDDVAMEQKAGKEKIEELEQQVSDLTANLRMRQQFTQNQELNEAQIYGTTEQVPSSSVGGRRRGRYRGYRK